MSENEAVNHPKHYNSGKIEVIEFIEDQGHGEGFCVGSAIKYLSRAGKKDSTKEIEDLEKAIWYIKRRVEILKAEKEGREITRPNAMNPKKESPPSLTEHTAKLVDELKTSSAMDASTSYPSPPEVRTASAFDVSRGPDLIADHDIHLGDSCEIDFVNGRVRPWGAQPGVISPRLRYCLVGEWIEIHPEGQEPRVIFLADQEVPDTFVDGKKHAFYGRILPEGRVTHERQDPS